MANVIEEIPVSEKRKADHIRLALQPENEASGLTGLDRVQLVHDALPEIDFEEVDITRKLWNIDLKTPFFIGSMTAGHRRAREINILLGKASEERGWLMGVGSQRRELFDDNAKYEWEKVIKECPKANLISNIGLSQLKYISTSQIEELADSIKAKAISVHTNPLQEALQPEGTPQFKGGLEALKKLCRDSKLPVVLKETGCGFSEKTALKIKDIGLAAIDISGLGGTHWGRIEGKRAPYSEYYMASETFKNWGVPTVESLIEIKKVLTTDIWASGGVRTGLDAAKLLAIGAKMVGCAKPILQALCDGSLQHFMKTVEFELKLAMFCSGCKRLSDLRNGVVKLDNKLY